MILTSVKQDDIPNIEDSVYDLAFDFEMEKGIMLSINIVNTEHFNYWLGALPYYDNVNREGIRVA